MNLYYILKQHERWLETDGEEGEQADLSGADLSGANLCEANLREANLFGADLREANLFRAELLRANLREVTGLKKSELHKRLGLNTIKW